MKKIQITTLALASLFAVSASAGIMGSSRNSYQDRDSGTVAGASTDTTTSASSSVPGSSAQHDKMAADRSSGNGNIDSGASTNQQAGTVSDSSAPSTDSSSSNSGSSPGNAGYGSSSGSSNLGASSSGRSN